jgi:transposase, IS30 family
VSTQRASDGVSLLMLQRTLSPRFLSLVDREMIKNLHASGTSVRATAAIIGRAPSIISRELRRNSSNNRSDKDRDGQTYQPYKAHRYAARRRLRPKERKLVTLEPLKDFVQNKLHLHWPPEQICHALIEEYPNNQEMRVSPETIYQTLYLQAPGGLGREVQAALRTGRTRRKQHNTGLERRSRFVDPMVMISEQPAKVEDRAFPGHWEGDLIVGTTNQHRDFTQLLGPQRAVFVESRRRGVDATGLSCPTNVLMAR